MGKIPIMNTLFIGIFILVIGAILLYVYNRLTVYEGFSNIPTASQTSSIPRDTPGATTADPTIAKPDAREVIDAQEAVNTFRDIYQPDKTGVRIDSSVDVSELMNKAPAFMKVLESFLEDPDNTATSDDILRMANKFRKANEQFRDSSDAEPFSGNFDENSPVEGFESQNDGDDEELDKNFADYNLLVDLFNSLYAKANLSRLSQIEQDEVKFIKDTPRMSREVFRDFISDMENALSVYMMYFSTIIKISSAIPKQTSVPSSNPTSVAHRSMLRQFRKAYESVNMSEDTDPKNEKKRNAAKFMYERDKTDNFSEQDLKNYIHIYDKLIDKLYKDELLPYLNSLPQRNPPANQEMPSQAPAPAPAQPTIIGSSSGHLTMEDLKLLLGNVESENLRLANIRSTSPNILTRRERLSQLAADLRDIILRIDRKQMRIEDVPIRVDDARRFLSALQAGQQPEEDLLMAGVPVPVTQTTVNGQGGPAMSDLPMNKMTAGMPTQEIFEALQGLKWSMDVKLDYDPAIGERSRIMRRLKEIEEKITAYAYSETPIPRNLQRALMKEISALSAALSQSMDEDKDRIFDTRFPTPYSSRMESGDGASYPSDMDTSFTPGFFKHGSPTGPRGSYDNDTKIRPGFTMNSETIARRGAASAFDESLVGGMDYKQRTQDLCRQIRGANLGDPANFGCITNPSEVSADYSWKGAHRMICNRLGDTWGSWYPEMFGCGPYDPQAKYKGTGL
jgi:hypothetical protein